MTHPGHLRAALVLLAAIGAGCGPADVEDGGQGGSDPALATETATPEGFGAAGVPRFTAVRLADRTVVTVALDVEESVERRIARIRLLARDGSELGSVSRDEPGASGRPIIATFDVPTEATSVTAEITDGAGTTWKRTWRLT